ncbi:lytic transglycosylase domain-containing protein [Protaetiibacter intestinalis]|uniref:Lytic transglycosylase domain-containing protein n=1 Tax=Protaetiibacter intestinalis TaxID=2419774 RepID=A0A387BF70_9MICO|nr:lytic transglycosylase domain-containing protein [Protaetiibacter intestinalis]
MLGVFAYLASIGLVAALLVEPTGLSSAATLAAAGDVAAIADEEGQTLEVTAGDDTHARDGFSVVKPKPVHAVAPAAGTPDPGTAKAIAYDMVMARGWNQAEYDCLVALWNKESHWNVYAHNTKSGAYGIPQALPGSKMASAGADWADNPTTQITWGLGYVAGRYGTPCGAWTHSQNKGWY